MICPKNKIAFIHIPKCAGSSVSSVLFTLEGYVGTRNLFKMDEAQLERYFVGTKDDNQHATQQEIEEKIEETGGNPSEWRFFTVVRDPFERAKSEVKYQLATQKSLKGAENYTSLSKAIVSGAVWQNAWKNHGRNSSSFLNGKQKVEVLKLESIDRDFKNLLERWLNKEIALPVLNKSKEGMKGELSENARLAIIQAWGSDFEMFGYPIEGEEELLSGWEKYLKWSEK